MRGLRALHEDRGGAVAVTAGLAIGVLFGFAALTVDASRFYLARRQQQTMTDLAAVAAAANIGSARAAAAASLSANGVPAASLAAVDLGSYVADPTVAAAQRFTLGGSSPNAAQVTLRAASPTFFGRVLGMTSATIGTRSIAVNANTAAFALGSTLASLDGGLANLVLGKLTNSTLSLSALDYAGLAAANVDLFGISNALATRIGASGSYASLAATTVRVADVVAAAADAGSAAGMPAAAVAALRAVAAAIGPSGPSLTYGSLVSFGAYGNLALGSTPPVAASLPALPLLAAAARLGAGAAEVSGSLSQTGQTISAVSVKMAMGEPTAGSSYAAIGPVGTVLHTAQTRVLLTLTLAPSSGIITTSVTLPLYVEVAPATATLSAVGCSAGASVDPAATLSVQPGAVDGWIGNVTDAALTNMSSPVSPTAATLVSGSFSVLGLPSLLSFTINGRAEATIANTSATSVPFTKADIAAGTMKSTATTDYTASLLSQLISKLQFSATQTILGVPVAATPPSDVITAIGKLLNADLPLIDAELSNTLGALGVTIGDADTWVRAAKCGQGALVN